MITQNPSLFFTFTLAFVAFAMPTANAGFVFDFQEVGSDVVLTGSGSINTAALTFQGNFPSFSTIFVRSFTGTVNAGGNSSNGSVWGGSDVFSGARNFGSNASGLFVATSHSGDNVGAQFSDARRLLLPENYISGTALSATATWNSTNFASLNLVPGVYTMTFGSGATADFFTVSVGQITAVPEPGAFTLICVAGLVVGAQRLIRRRTRQ